MLFSLSILALSQIKQLGARLEKDNFTKQKGIQLVAHSPLKRARQTSEGMLRCVTPRPDVTTEEDSTAAGAKASCVSRVVELEILKERTPLEWLPTHQVTFRRRIASFEQWLRDQPEDVIAIVGHSQYFKSMLGLGYKFGNCDVWELQFDCSVLMNDEDVDVDVNVAETGETKRKFTATLKESLSFARLKLTNDVDSGEKNEVSSSSPDYQISKEGAQGSSEEVIELPGGWKKLTNLYSYDEHIKS